MNENYICIGAGPGIGLSTAIRFARAGYQPVIASRNKAMLLLLADKIRVATGIEAHTVAMNSTDIRQVQALADEYGKHASVLHYNAAVTSQRTIQETPQALAHDVQVNITAALWAINAFLPYMKDREEGSLLLTGGGFALHPRPDYLTLSIGKAGIRSMTQALFEELKKNNIHIGTVTVTQTIDPGSAAADAVADAFWQLYAQRKENWQWEISC